MGGIRDSFAKAPSWIPNHADTWAAMLDMSVLDAALLHTAWRRSKRPCGLIPIPARWYLCHLGQAQYAAYDYQGGESHTCRRRYITNSRKFPGYACAVGRPRGSAPRSGIVPDRLPHFVSRARLTTG